MGANFNVTPAELVEGSKALGTISTDFLKEVDVLFNSLEDLMTKWQGAGSNEYYQGALNYKGDIQEIGKVIGQYDNFLLRAATTYDGTDSDVAGAAGGMFGGRG